MRGRRHTLLIILFITLLPAGSPFWHPSTVLLHSYPITMSSSSSSTSTSTTTGDAAAALEFLRLAGKLKGTVRTGWVYSGVGEAFSCKRVESVADHSWRMSVASLLYTGVPCSDDEATRRHYDVAKMCQMAALHDIAEALTGDIAPADMVSKAEKARREGEAMATISGALAGWGDGGGAMGGAGTLEALMAEYEARESPESIAVKDLDMLEMIVQADAYERMREEERGAEEESEGNANKRRKTEAAGGGSGGGGGGTKEEATNAEPQQPAPALDLSDFFRTTSGKFRTAPAQAIAAELVRQRDERRRRHGRRQP